MLKRIRFFITSWLLLCVFLISGCGTTQTTSQTKYSLSLEKTTYNLLDGEQAALRINFTADGKEADWALLTFESDNESVATVSGEGKITAVSEGTANVTVTHAEKSVTATVKVRMRFRDLVLSKEKLTLLSGTSVDVTAEAYLDGKIDQNAEVVWTSENPSVATVENGKITAVSRGETTINVTYGLIKKSVRVVVVDSLTAENVNSFDERYINIYGRSYISNGKLNLDHAANAVEVGFVGTSFSVKVSSNAESYMRVFVDNAKMGNRLKITSGEKKYTVAENLTDECHTIRIVKASEEQDATWDISSFEASGFVSIAEKSDLKIEFIGDSITAGYAVLGAPGESRTVQNSDSTSTYAYLTAQQLNANYSTIAWSGICAKAYHWAKPLNMATLYGQISKTKTSEYEFDFNPDVIVLNLGTNEADYMSPSYGGEGYGEIFPNDYRDFLTYIRQKNPNAYIICLYGMMGTNNVISEGIKTAVNGMNDAKIVYNPFAFSANNAGGAAHPDVSGQTTWANALVEYIETLDIE